MKSTTFAKLISEGVLEIGDGYRAKLEELGGKGPIFLRAVHVTEEGIDLNGVERFKEELAPRLMAKMSRPRDTVVTTKGNSAGRATFVDPSLPSFVYSPHLSFWRSKDDAKLLPGYLRFWAIGTEFQEQLEAMKGSTDMAPYLSLLDQKSLKITLPEPEEQQAVAAVLGSLEDKIDLNRRMNRTLESMAAALFKAWFVDFDPVVAKAAGRTPYGLDDATVRLFPDGFVELGKGPVPRGWSIGSLTKIADIRGGGTPKTSEPTYWNGDHQWFSVVDAPALHDVFVVRTEKTITDSGLAESAAELLPIGTTIITARGTVGKLAVTAVPMTMNQSCYGLQPKEPFGPCFVFFWAKELVEELQQMVHGSVFDTITRATLADVSVVIPSETIGKRFEELASPWLDQIRLNVNQNLTLSKTRDSLLTRLLSGELSLADADKQVATVL